MKEYLRLIRVPQLLIIVVAQLLTYFCIILPTVADYGFMLMLPYWKLASIVAATMLIAAGGFVINDYFDMKIDRLNRPDSVIVGNSISKKDTMYIYQILTVAGVALGVIASVTLKSFTLAFIFVIVAGLMWFYSSSYKRMLIVGNLMVALMAALVPMVPAFAAKEQLILNYDKVFMSLPIIPTIYTKCCFMALMALLIVMANEIVKDIISDYGDREMECHTIAVVWGDKVSRIIATVLIAGACCVAVYAFGWRYALCIIAVAAFYVYATWKWPYTKYCSHISKLMLLLTIGYSILYYYQIFNA